MGSARVTETKTNLCEPLDVGKAGETVASTRRGKRVAPIVAEQARSKPFDFAALKAMTDQMAPQDQAAGRFMREVRHGDRF